jgi:hypothetical protein
MKIRLTARKYLAPEEIKLRKELSMKDEKLRSFGRD